MIIPMTFRGMRWQMPEVSQGGEYATTAHNMYRYNSALEPLRSGAKSQTLPSADFLFARSFFLHDECFVATEQNTDFATTQVVGDKARRMYFVENGLLQFLPKNEIPTNYPTPTINGHRSGIDDPIRTAEVLPTLTDNGEGFSVSNNIFAQSDPNTPVGYNGLPADERDLYVETAFVYTYVNRFGEEGPPSNPSRSIYVSTDGGTVLLSGLAYSNDPDVVAIRIYALINGEYLHIPYSDEVIPETATTTRIENFAVLNDFTRTNATFGGVRFFMFDAFFSEETPGIQLVSQTWDQAPEGVKHLADLDNGVLAVADDHNVYLSVPYTWHAFPAVNSYAVEGTIQRIANIGGGFAVMTDRGTEFFFGSQPEAMFQSTVTFPYSIRDPESLMEFENSAIFICDDGIAAVSAEGGSIITDGWVERENWRRRISLDECKTGMYEGRVLVATRNPENGDPIGYCFNLAIQEVTSFDITEETLKSGFFRDRRNNEISYVTDAQGMTLFNQGGQLVAIWESGDIWIPRNASLNSLYVESDEYPVTVKVTPKRQPTRTIEVRHQRPRRMPATGRSKSIRVRVESGQQVGRCELASDLRGF